MRRVSVHQYISRTGGLYKTAQSGSFQRLKVKMVPEIPLILNGLSAVRKVPCPPKTVVTISRNEPLQMTRTALLHRAGYSVVPLTSDADVMRFLALDGRPAINLILMCHSVPESSRVSLCKAIKKHIPGSPILMLYNGYDPTAAEVDGRLENVQSPQALLDTVQFLLSKPEVNEPMAG